jgi:hypothetical protein
MGYTSDRRRLLEQDQCQVTGDFGICQETQRCLQNKAKELTAPLCSMLLCYYSLALLSAFTQKISLLILRIPSAEKVNTSRSFSLCSYTRSGFHLLAKDIDQNEQRFLIGAELSSVGQCTSPRPLQPPLSKQKDSHHLSDWHCAGIPSSIEGMQILSILSR